MTKGVKEVKVIFDTNFWSYLAQSQRASDFEKLERGLNLQTLLPPSILLEAARTRDSSTRVSILRTMNRGHRTRLRTEADLEAEELVNEVRRLRPSLRRLGASTKRVSELRRFWTRDIWDKCLEEHERLHQVSIQKQQDEVRQLIADQKINKENFAKWDINKAIPSGITATYQKAPHLEGIVDLEREYEAWRIQNAEYYKKYLKLVSLPLDRDERTVADWCEAYMKIDLFLNAKKEYYDFWLNGVEARRMPRNYTRWAMDFLQPFRKISDGNAFDGQHSAYLVGSDLFFTCDRRYFGCLEVIYQDKVVHIARPILLSSEIGKSLQEIESAVEEWNAS